MCVTLSPVQVAGRPCCDGHSGNESHCDGDGQRDGGPQRVVLRLERVTGSRMVGILRVS